MDLRSAIAQVVDLYPSAVDGRAVAVFGASYGGAHAWLGALAPEFTTRGGRSVVVRTVIPVAAWSDLLNGLAPNGRPDSAQDPAGAQKLSFVEGLFAGGIRTRADRPYPNYPEYLVLWDAQLLANEAPYSATPTGRMLVDGLQGYRSVYWQESLWERVRQRHAPVGTRNQSNQHHRLGAVIQQMFQSTQCCGTISRQHLIRQFPIHQFARAADKFFDEIHLGKDSVAGFVKRLLGYGITGLTTEHFIGVFKGAEERSIRAFGTNKDQNALSPSVLASAVIDMPRAFVETARRGERGVGRDRPAPRP